MKLSYPFNYDAGRRSTRYFSVGKKVLDYYLQWIDTDDYKYVEAAVPYMTKFVACCWNNLFHSKSFDLDVMDPASYAIIEKFIAKTLIYTSNLPMLLRAIVRNRLITDYYSIKFIPEMGDSSRRSFNYSAFQSPLDIENKIFMEDVRKVLVKRVYASGRLTPIQRGACAYIAKVTMNERTPSGLVLLEKFKVPYKDHKFLIDFTAITVRKELYRIRESLPDLFKTDNEAFIGVSSEDYWYSEDSRFICEENTEVEATQISDF